MEEKEELYSRKSSRLYHKEFGFKIGRFYFGIFGNWCRGGTIRLLPNLAYLHQDTTKWNISETFDSDDYKIFTEWIYGYLGFTLKIKPKGEWKRNTNGIRFGDEVFLTENSRTLFGFADGEIYTVSDELRIDVEHPIVITNEKFGKDWKEFVSLEELIKVEEVV